LPYGKNYTTISSYKYQGAQYSDKGSGLTGDMVTVYSTEPNPYETERLETLAKVLTKQSGTHVSKYELMDDAIEAFLEELRSEGLDLDQLAKEIAQL